MDKVDSSIQEPHSLKNFNPEELTAIYFGCRMDSGYKESIINLISNWKTEVKLFQMRDERVRFALKTEP